MKRSWLWICAGVVSLIATLSLAGQQADSRQASSNLANSFSSKVPRLVKFSGVLKDLTGKPLTGPVEVNFAIYKEQGDAVPLWQEAQTLQLDELGRYTVLLGAMQAEGLPMELFATGEARWLAVQAQGAQAQPRVLLVSVPYALKAADAETLSGKPVSDFVLAQQLKEQVQTAVAQQAKKQQDRGQQALAMVLSQGPTPMVTSQGQTSFTCPSGTSGDCVTVTQSSTGRALYAVANSTAEALRVTQSGTGYGLLAMSSASGVYGVSTATTGTVFGIRGESASTEGRGILGFATATTGGTIGLWGNAASTSGTGLLGDATATTGYTYGLRGRSYSSSGTGILAYAVATTGTTKGLWAEVYSAGGTAAVFQNTVSGGKLLSAVTGTGTGTEVFSLAGSGNLTTAGSVTAASLTGSGAGLTNLTAANISAGTANINISGNAATAASATTAATATNASELGGFTADKYARLDIANSFAATQTISSGDLSVSGGKISLPPTSSASAGVINVGNAAFMHACCSADQYNTFVGSGAGNFTTTGSANTASGYQALSSNGSGYLNTASGYQALSSNTAGFENTASGVQALYSNTTALANTAIGVSALFYNCHNVPSGCAAHYNTALGYQAGVTSTLANANVTGASNTFIGANSGPGTSAQLNNATAIGYNALVSTSNALVLGGTGANAVNVGIGTASPAATLQIDENNAENADTLLIGNGTTRGLALFDTGLGVDVKSIGVPLYINYPGNQFTILNALASSTGYVGIGTSTPGHMLDVVGDINASGSVTASSFVGPLSGTATNLNCTGCVSASELDFVPATQAGLNAEATARAAADTALQTDINGRVLKAGDTMTGTLNLPANGLVAGTNQLVISGGNVGIGTASPSQKLEVTGNVRAQGLMRVGSETGTADPPQNSSGGYNGLVIRRINSTDYSAGRVLARTDVLTLERDGTYAGLRVAWPAGTGFQSIACTGIDKVGGQVTFYTAFENHFSAGNMSIYTDAQRMVYVQCSFGDTYNSFHLTQVILSRYDDGSISDWYWVGVVTSTYNQ